MTLNVLMTKHVLSTVVEIHVSYQIFVDKEQYARHLLIDQYADAQKDGVVYQQHNVFNVSIYCYASKI